MGFFDLTEILDVIKWNFIHIVSFRLGDCIWIQIGFNRFNTFAPSFTPKADGRDIASGDEPFQITIVYDVHLHFNQAFK